MWAFTGAGGVTEKAGTRNRILAEKRRRKRERQKGNNMLRECEFANEKYGAKNTDDTEERMGLRHCNCDLTWQCEERTL